MEIVPEKRAAPSSSPPSGPVFSLICSWYAGVLAWSERFVSGAGWQLKVLLLAVLVSVFFAGGVDMRLINDGPGLSDNNGMAYGYSDGYYQKIENPWLDLTKLYEAGSHDAKLNARLTVPLVLHYLGIRSRWSLPALTIFAICAIILLSCAITFRMTGDRVTSLFVALGVASTYIGSFAVIAYYDAVALAQLLAAVMPGFKPWVKGLLVFTASFTDERAFIAAAFLLVPELWAGEGKQDRFCTRLLRPGFLAVIAGMGAWLLGRFLLWKFGGLRAPADWGGFKLFLQQIPLMHAGLWYGLEGGWLVAALGGLLLWRGRQWTTLLLMAAVTGVLLIGSVAMADVTRSTAYLLPLLFISLMIFAAKETPASLRGWCFVMFLISLIGGNYNVFGGHIHWCEPFIIILFESLYRLVWLWW